METKIRIGDKLVQYGYINEKQLLKALSMQKDSGKRIGEVLVECGMITEELLVDVLKELLNVDYTELVPKNIMVEATEKIPQNVCRRYTIFPYKIENNKLYLAMEDPQDIEAIQDVKRISGMDVEKSISTMSQINNAIDKCYSDRDIDKAINEYAKNEVHNKIHEEITGDEDLNSAPIVRLVYNVLETAVRMNASDIHIENDGDFMRVRLRIDGMLFEQIKVSSKAYKAIVNRIKIMANLDIAEKRLPQDGRFFLEIDNRTIDFRVSTMPTSNEEKVVMRVLDKSNFMVDKNKLGFTSHGITLFNNLISQPYGLILVVGPTGSGKTTTLYSMLNQLNNSKKNILTIEDPIEYELKGINQSQINYKAGLDFTNALRAFLRQDPDIIMVGEIRDKDTAEIAIRASLTGHLVLSTLHSNTSVGAVSRLFYMGINSFLITSSLTGVISQRLVRKICTHCTKKYTASIGEKRALGINENEDITLFKGVGCERCNNTGYQGRVGAYEILKLTKELKELIDNGCSESELLEKAKEMGLVTMNEDIISKVLKGETTVDEMIRVTFVDE